MADVVTCYTPLKGWRDAETGAFTGTRQRNSTGGSLRSAEMEVACGQCIGCRLDYARMWTQRIVHEASMHEHAYGNCWTTLTYDDEHLPPNGGLDKVVFRNFMKRLRKAHPNQRIRFYQCGEYGETYCTHGIYIDNCPGCNHGRPHHHVCLFNCRFEDLVVFDKNKMGEPLYTSPKLTKIWQQGITQVSELTRENAGYTARYTMKKITGERAKDHYRRIDPETGEIGFILPEYSTMSRVYYDEEGKARPGGIGTMWYNKFKSDVFPSDEVPMPTGVQKKAPRFYVEKLREEDEDAYEQLKQRRKEYGEKHSADSTPERLLTRGRVKLAQINSLKRNIER